MLWIEWNFPGVGFTVAGFLGGLGIGAGAASRKIEIYWFNIINYLLII